MHPREMEAYCLKMVLSVLNCGHFLLASPLCCIQPLCRRSVFGRLRPFLYPQRGRRRHRPVRRLLCPTDYCDIGLFGRWIKALAASDRFCAQRWLRFIYVLHPLPVEENFCELILPRSNHQYIKNGVFFCHHKDAVCRMVHPDKCSCIRFTRGNPAMNIFVEEREVVRQRDLSITARDGDGESVDVVTSRGSRRSSDAGPFAALFTTTSMCGKSLRTRLVNAVISAIRVKSTLKRRSRVVKSTPPASAKTCPTRRP